MAKAAKRRVQRVADQAPEVEPHTVTPLGTTGAVEVTCRNNTDGRAQETRYQMPWRKRRKTEVCRRCHGEIEWPADAGEPGRIA